MIALETEITEGSSSPVKTNRYDRVPIVGITFRLATKELTPRGLTDEMSVLLDGLKAAHRRLDAWLLANSTLTLDPAPKILILPAKRDGNSAA